MRGAVRSGRIVGFVAGLSLTVLAGSALAQSDERNLHTSEPARVIWSVGIGGSLRFIRDLDFAQDRLAPAYIDAFGAFVFEGSGIRHGVGLDLSTNLSGDGAGRLSVDPAHQWVLSPTYVAFIDLTSFLRVHGKAGLPFSVGPAFAPGVDVAVGVVYRLLAGFGVYTELATGAYLGSEVVHPFVSAEVGAYFDYEVLP